MNIGGVNRTIIGTATVVDEGFDVDRMMRWTTYKFDPPCDGMETMTMHDAAIDDDALPTPMDDDMVHRSRERFVRRLGYRLAFRSTKNNEQSGRWPRLCPTKPE